MLRRSTPAPGCARLAATVIVALSSSPALAETYAYDATGRLTQVVYDDRSVIAYSYDANSSLRTLTIDRDDDADDVRDGIDNCVGLTNPTQADLDSDGQGDPCDADDDGDGMPDAFETRHGLDPRNAADASGDADNDNLSNLDEFRNGTNPRNPDSDGDGVNDGAEVARGSSPLFNEALITPLFQLLQ